MMRRIEEDDGPTDDEIRDDAARGIYPASAGQAVGRAVIALERIAAALERLALTKEVPNK